MLLTWSSHSWLTVATVRLCRGMKSEQFLETRKSSLAFWHTFPVGVVGTFTFTWTGVDDDKVRKKAIVAPRCSSKTREGDYPFQTARGKRSQIHTHCRNSNSMLQRTVQVPPFNMVQKGRVRRQKPIYDVIGKTFHH